MAALVFLCATGTAQAGALPGETSYESQCASCHGSSLTGGKGPALHGDSFMQEWRQKSARKLYGRILTTMPVTAPGSLSPATALDLTIYLLGRNGVTVAAKTPDELNTITIK